MFLFYKEKELFTGEGCVEMDIPWKLCRTIGPLTLHSQEIAFSKNVLFPLPPGIKDFFLKKVHKFCTIYLKIDGVLQCKPAIKFSS